MCFVDEPVPFVVEILRLEHIGTLVDGVVVNDQRAEHRLLGFDRVWRGAKRLYVGNRGPFDRFYRRRSVATC